MKFLIGIFFCFFALSVQASILEDLRVSAKQNCDSKISITQQKTISLFGETIESKIIVFTSVSGKMRMQTISPFEAVSIFDTKSFVRFEKKNNKWQKLESKSSMIAKRIFDEIKNLLLGNISSSDYNISEKSKTLVLVPKNSAVQKFVARIEIFTKVENAKRIVCSIKIIDADSDTTLLNFDKIESVKVPDNIFNTDTLTEITK